MSVYGLIVRNRRTARRRDARRDALGCADLARLQGCNVSRAAWLEAVAAAQSASRRGVPMLELRADVHSVRADVLAGREA